jgi:hypothetical protein
MAASIEIAFAELCAKHELTHLDIGGGPSGKRWVSYAHWGPRKCAQGFGDSAAAAIENAIAKVNEARASEPSVPALVLDIAA